MNVYKIITGKIIEKLKDGVVPWKKPWCGDNPQNFVTKHQYRGVNALLTGLTSYTSPYWITFNQARSLDIHINKGEKATMIVYFNLSHTTPKNNNLEKCENLPEIKKNKQSLPMILKCYYIFNLEQTDYIRNDIEFSYVPQKDSCENIVDNWKNKPQVLFGGNRAYYSLSQDTIHMPIIHTFDSTEEYYSTLFHEAIHSTAHPHRLNRKEITAYSGRATKEYGVEELIAEIGSSFLCNKTGISNAVFDNQASYINHWLTSLQNDKTLLVKAANKAQKAVDYILNEVNDE